MNELNQKIRALAEAEDRLGQAIDAREDKLKELSDQKETLARHRGEAQRLETEIADLQQRLDAAQAEHETQKTERETAREALDQTIKAIGEVTQAGQAKKLHGSLVEREATFAEAHKSFSETDMALARFTELRDRADREFRRKNSVIENSDDRVVEAREESMAAARAVNEAEAEVGAAIDALADAIGRVGNGHAPQIDPQVVKLLSRTGTQRRRDFLDIRTRSTALDDLARSALDSLAMESDEVAPRERMRERLLQHGIATEIGKVTGRLNGVRQSDIRRSIMAAAYPALLRHRLEDDGEINADAARDTIGLADTLLLDLESEDGPLDRYAALLADAAIADLRLDADPGSAQRQLITAQVRASL